MKKLLTTILASLLFVGCASSATATSRGAPMVLTVGSATPPAMTPPLPDAPEDPWTRPVEPTPPPPREPEEHELAGLDFRAWLEVVGRYAGAIQRAVNVLQSQSDYRQAHSFVEAGRRELERTIGPNVTQLSAHRFSVRLESVLRIIASQPASDRSRAICEQAATLTPLKQTKGVEGEMYLTLYYLAGRNCFGK